MEKEKGAHRASGIKFTSRCKVPVAQGAAKPCRSAASIQLLNHPPILKLQIWGFQGRAELRFKNFEDGKKKRKKQPEFRFGSSPFFPLLPFSFFFNFHFHFLFFSFFLLKPSQTAVLNSKSDLWSFDLILFLITSPSLPLFLFVFGRPLLPLKLLNQVYQTHDDDDDGDGG